MNIFLKKEKCFQWTNKKENLSLASKLSYKLVEKWVKKYKLHSPQTKDFTIDIDENRYRVHLFNSSDDWVATLRLLPSKIFTFEELGIDSDDVLSVCKGVGLVLFCGAMGAGKSTTMSTAIDSLQRSGELGTAITIEDPIEYLYHKDEITQREVGESSHVKSFKHGIVDAVRANSKTIIIGEIRDSETAHAAVEIASSGHRVMATLHAGSVQQAIERMWSLLDDQADEEFIPGLQGIVAQHLINISSTKKYCIYEALEIDARTKNLLNQVLDKSAKLTQLEQIQFDQRRLTLTDKKAKLINDGIDATLLNFIRS